MTSEKKIFEYLFRKFSLLVAMPPIKISNLDQIHMAGGGLLRENFCETFVKKSAVACQFPFFPL